MLLGSRKFGNLAEIGSKIDTEINVFPVLFSINHVRGPCQTLGNMYSFHMLRSGPKRIDFDRFYADFTSSFLIFSHFLSTFFRKIEQNSYPLQSIQLETYPIRRALNKYSFLEPYVLVAQHGTRVMTS